MSNIRNKIRNIISNLPSTPGVYKFKDKDQRVIYIGKAKNLKKRVSSYFQKRKQVSGFFQIMVPKIADIEYLTTASELEALLLETNLIKEIRPKYNILMKDDKNFIYLKITTEEDFPRLLLVRQVDKDKAKYFGPKTSVAKVRETLDLLRKLFPVRNCNLGIKEIKRGEVAITQKTINYPCLEYHIKKCCAPCLGKYSREEYRKLISYIIDFLSGQQKKFLKELKTKMEQAASNKKFEQAATLRDKILAIESVLEKQKISSPEHIFQDVIGFVHDSQESYFNLFIVRDGKLIASENFILKGAGESSQILASFLKQYYQETTDLPAEILIPEEIEDKALIEKLISDLKGSKVKITVSSSGLVKMSLNNAANFAKQQKLKWEQDEKRTTGASEELAKMLKLKKTRRIECYDVSHLGGQQTVGSMIVFENGKPKNKDFRHFKLAEGKINDYQTLQEIFNRRLKYLPTASHSYRISSVSDNDWKKVLKIIKQNDDVFDLSDLQPKEFKIIRQNKEIITLGRLKELTGSDCELKTVWVKPNVRGQKLGYLLIEKLISGSNFKKVYVITFNYLVDYYRQFGFVEVKSIPEVIKKEFTRVTKELEGGQPFLLMIETAKLKKTDASFKQKPDLMIVDGGKGQLAVLNKVLQKFTLKIPTMALAKKEEEIFISNKSIKLGQDSLVLQLLQRIRDEAHRFAISYNHNLRNKKIIQSSLDNIPGLGDKIRTKLLNKFGSVAKIKEVSWEDLSKVVGEKMAAKIKKNL